MLQHDDIFENKETISLLKYFNVMEQQNVKMFQMNETFDNDQTVNNM